MTEAGVTATSDSRGWGWRPQRSAAEQRGAADARGRRAGLGNGGSQARRVHFDREGQRVGRGRHNCPLVPAPARQSRGGASRPGVPVGYSGPRWSASWHAWTRSRRRRGAVRTGDENGTAKAAAATAEAAEAANPTLAITEEAAEPTEETRTRVRSARRQEEGGGGGRAGAARSSGRS